MRFNVKIIQLLLGSIGIFLIFITYFLVPENFGKNTIGQKEIIKKDDSTIVIDNKEANLFENVEYKGVYNINNEHPSKLAVHSNAHALARYAALVQESNMVPIVEPELLMDGNHSAEDCFKKTSEVIKKCFEELILHKIDLTGVILKPNMILPGSENKIKTSGEEIANLTVKCLKESVPSEVPGVAFLSGGQTEIESTENLNLINKFNDTKFIMSFSYGRALQQSALKNWSKNIKDIEGTQKVFNHRAKMNTLAAQGKWSKHLEN